MTDPAVIDPGEELLGRIGLAHALSGSDKAIRVFANTPDLSEAIDDTAHRFIFEPKTPAKVALAPLDYDELNRQLSQLKEPNHEAFRYLDAHLISAYLVAVQRAVQYIAKVFPRDTVTDMATTRNLRPSEMKISKFRRIWGVANDVQVVFRSLLDGTLVKDQAVALQMLYPTVFDALKFELLNQIAEKVGAEKVTASTKTTWSLPFAKDQLLQTILLTDAGDAAAMKRLQQNFADAKARKGEEAEQQQAAKDSNRGPTSTETPIQRSAR